MATRYGFSIGGGDGGGGSGGATVFETVPLTMDTTLTDGQTNAVITNLGAAGAVVATLPAAVAGLKFSAVVKAAYQLKFLCGAGDKIFMGLAAPDGGSYVYSSELQASVQIFCARDGEWNVLAEQLGVWSIG